MSRHVVCHDYRSIPTLYKPHWKNSIDEAMVAKLDIRGQKQL